MEATRTSAVIATCCCLLLVATGDVRSMPLFAGPMEVDMAQHRAALLYQPHDHALAMMPPQEPLMQFNDAHNHLAFHDVHQYQQPQRRMGDEIYGGHQVMPPAINQERAMIDAAMIQSQQAEYFPQIETAPTMMQSIFEPQRLQEQSLLQAPAAAASAAAATEIQADPIQASGPTQRRTDYDEAQSQELLAREEELRLKNQESVQIEDSVDKLTDGVAQEINQIVDQRHDKNYPEHEQKYESKQEEGEGGQNEGKEDEKEQSGHENKEEHKEEQKEGHEQEHKEHQEEQHKEEHHKEEPHKEEHHKEEHHKQEHHKEENDKEEPHDKYDDLPGAFEVHHTKGGKSFQYFQQKHH